MKGLGKPNICDMLFGPSLQLLLCHVSLELVPVESIEPVGLAGIKPYRPYRPSTLWNQAVHIMFP